MKSGIRISKKDEERRRFILDGNPWNVLISISLPLVLYNTIGQFFSFFDALVASNISSSVVSTVSFVSQIQQMLSSFGSGLGIGGGIIIARYFGAGDLEQVKKNINTLMFLVLGVCGLILLIIIPFASPFLRLLRMPEDLLSIGSIYFILETCMQVCIFINTIYFAIEKAKGNTKIILYFNFLVLLVKLILTVIFIYVFHGGILMLSAASFAAHTIITCIALRTMTKKSNPFAISFREIDFSIKTLKPILTLSLPVFMERFAFSFGKVIVNSMCAFYGSTVIGALGVSNRISAVTIMPPNGVEEAESSIVSQNLGNKNTRRALGIFKRAFVINLGLGIFFFTPMMIFKGPIISLFSEGDPVFGMQIAGIYSYECYGNILLAINAAVMGLLYGFGYTKISMILNMARLFLFRIPPLWLMQNFTSIGSEGIGMVMLISNAMVGISSVIVAIFLIRKKTQAESCC
ncbi:MATE family efflux transporter [Spirochaetia bacterium]|nr:MATE family efflux transporter [Spirochaetia bacterium]